MTRKNSFQGPFVAGFVAGIAAGAAGVYFFATEKGEDFLKEMGELWEEAKPELVEQGVISSTDKTLGGAVKSFLIELAAEQAKEAQTEVKKRVRNSDKHLFKGV